METRKCSKCQMVKPVDQFYKHKRDGYRPHCKPCQKEDNKVLYEKLQADGYFVRRWQEYSQQPEVRKQRLERLTKYRADPKVKIKNMARWFTSHEIRAGRLSRQPCAICDKEQVEAHHLDYNLPLLIVWLCPYCHRKLHFKIKEEG